MDKWWFRLAMSLYAAAMSALWPVFFLYYAIRTRRDGKYSGSRAFRMGSKVVSFPKNNDCIWIHALSVGETLSVVPFVKALHALAPDACLVFSSSTETGHEIAVKRLEPWVKRFFFMPHDFPWLVERYVSAVNPKAFVLVETDIWPRLLLALRRRGVCTLLLNGRISRGSFRKLLWVRGLLRPVYEAFHWIFVQSEEDKARFESLGGRNGRVHAGGNIKFDASFQDVSPSELHALRTATGIEAERPAWIAGSTHPGEEEVVLRVHRALKEDLPDLLLILAPRQVRRGTLVNRLARDHGFSTACRSLGERAYGKDVFILDTLGELYKFYALAHAAFIGGSLVPFGGHNPLEATAQCIPVFWGVHLFNFREIEQALISWRCGDVVSSQEDLADRVKAFLVSPQRREEVQREARSFWNMHRGASEDIARFLCERCGIIRTSDSRDPSARVEA